MARRRQAGGGHDGDRRAFGLRDFGVAARAADGQDRGGLRLRRGTDRRQSFESLPGVFRRDASGDPRRRHAGVLPCGRRPRGGHSAAGGRDARRC